MRALIEDDDEEKEEKKKEEVDDDDDDDENAERVQAFVQEQEEKEVLRVLMLVENRICFGRIIYCISSISTRIVA